MEDQHRPTHDRLLITIAVGFRALEILDLTLPAMADYAAKCNAQLVVLTNPTQNWWGLEKFRVRRFAQQHRQTLFLDVDVFIRADAPNLFAVVPEGQLAMHDDFDALKSTSWIEKDLEELRRTQSIETLPTRCLNTGVVLCDPSTADLWTPPIHQFQHTHTMEQTWVEQTIRRGSLPVRCLQNRWNCQWWQKDFRERSIVSHFVHLANAGHEERIELLKKLVKQSRSGRRDFL